MSSSYNSLAETLIAAITTGRIQQIRIYHRGDFQDLATLRYNDVFSCNHASEICYAALAVISQELPGRLFQAYDEMRSLTVAVQTPTTTLTYNYQQSHELGKLYRLNQDNVNNRYTRLVLFEVMNRRSMPVTLRYGVTDYDMWFVEHTPCTYTDFIYNGRYNPVYAMLRMANVFSYIPSHDVAMYILDAIDYTNKCIYGTYETHLTYQYNASNHSLVVFIKPEFFQKVCQEIGCSSASTENLFLMIGLSAYRTETGDAETLWGLRLTPAILVDQNLYSNLSTNGLRIAYKLPTAPPASALI